jgi:hypothetical protein
VRLGGRETAFVATVSRVGHRVTALLRNATHGGTVTWPHAAKRDSLRPRLTRGAPTRVAMRFAFNHMTIALKYCPISNRLRLPLTKEH